MDLFFFLETWICLLQSTYKQIYRSLKTELLENLFFLCVQECFFFACRFLFDIVCWVSPVRQRIIGRHDPNSASLDYSSRTFHTCLHLLSHYIVNKSHQEGFFCILLTLYIQFNIQKWLNCYFSRWCGLFRLSPGFWLARVSSPLRGYSTTSCFYIAWQPAYVDADKVILKHHPSVQEAGKHAFLRNTHMHVAFPEILERAVLTRHCTLLFVSKVT